MGILSRLGLSTKESAFSDLIVSQFPTGQPVWTPDNFEKLAREGYRISPIVYGCVDYLARGAAGIPLLLYRLTEEGDRRGRKSRLRRAMKNQSPKLRRKTLRRMLEQKEVEEFDSHRLLDLLDKPNDSYGGARLIEALVAYRQLSGNAYLEAVGPDRQGAPPVELYVHRPDRMRVVVGDRLEPVAAYEYQVGGRVDRIEATQVLHWKTFNPLDDWYGQAPLIAAARSTDMNNAGRAWNVALTQNAARPSGILKVTGATSNNKASLEKFVTYLKDNWMGWRNAGRPAVIASPEGAEVDWVQTAFTPVEISWLEGLNLSLREICAVFKVPSILMGDTQASTFANYEQARKALYQEGVFPLMDLLMSDLNNWLVPMFGDNLWLDYDADAVEAVQEDQNEQHKRAREDWKAGMLTLDEARASIGYGEVEDKELGGKFYWQVAPRPTEPPEGKDPDPDKAAA